MYVYIYIYTRLHLHDSEKPDESLLAQLQVWWDAG